MFIHKNEVRKYLVRNDNDNPKIGKEIMVRWIDVPEFLEVEPLDKEIKLPDKKLMILTGGGWDSAPSDEFYGWMSQVTEKLNKV